ncbi:dihydroorotase [Nitrosospira briensis]|uniref:dihydroorotase n=1 Tax=Nitrosospira briensis TaxID=35799 RepID=UPI00046AB93A
MKTLTLTRPDDCHLHLRDGEQMRAVLPDTARRFARAIVMPNLKPPIITVEMALAYREHILAALPPGMRFEPLMTLYLTDNTAPSEIFEGRRNGTIHGVKFYPAGATTNSAAGVTDIAKCYGTLAAMEEAGMPLLVHGEVTDPAVDVFDREKSFLDRVLMPLTQRFPQLRIVFEHITTQEAVAFVTGARAHIAATITAHHMLLNRNALFQGGIRPHHYCLPVLKRETHRQKLVEAATSGNPKFFLGTDSAPHPRSAKESTCGCAGVYTAHAAIELYAEAFELAGALDKLEAFASFHGADFYKLPRNKDSIMLKKENWSVPSQLGFGNEALVPLRAGESLAWKLIG